MSETSHRQSARTARHAVVAALAALVMILVSACSAEPVAAPPVPTDLGALPEPPGVETVPAAPHVPQPPPSCDASASLRPMGALPPPGQMPTGSTMARILDRGRLIAGVDQNTYLFGFRNSTTGTIEGFDIDMVHEVAQAIFGDPSRIQFKVITSAERIPALQRGDVDIVAHTMTATCERWRSVDFSSIYYLAGQRVLVNRGSPVRSMADLGGSKVCADGGTTSIDNIAAAPSHPVPVVVQNWTDCLVLLQQRQVDAISTDDSVLAGIAVQDPNTQLVGPRFTDEPYGLAVAKQNTDFVRFVNAVLAKMRTDGSWTASYQRWLAPLGPAPLPPQPHYQS